jgi:AcrR family transcriptional regulator
MGRRSIHTPEELRELIIEAGTQIVEQDGLEGLSAREIAKRIGYSPGTLYNVFDNLDDLLLTIEARLLDGLAQRIALPDSSGTPEQRLRRLLNAYFAYSQEKPKLWNLLVEHRMPIGAKVPDWYRDKLDGLLQPIEQALIPIVDGSDPKKRAQAARALWAGVHGMTSLSTNKLSHVTARSGAALVDDLVSNYLAGLKASRAK